MQVSALQRSKGIEFIFKRKLDSEGYFRSKVVKDLNEVKSPCVVRVTNHMFDGVQYVAEKFYTHDLLGLE